MVKLYGPVLSIDARGTLASAVTVQHRAGRPSLSRKIAPKQPMNQLQWRTLSIAAAFSHAWHAMTQQERDTWKPIATSQRADPYARFRSDNWARINVNLWPKILDAGGPAGHDPYFDNHTWTPGPRCITLHGNLFPNSSCGFAIIFTALGVPPYNNMNGELRMFAIQTIDPIPFVCAHLEPGQHAFHAVLLDQWGNKGGVYGSGLLTIPD